jgi:membrane protease YdiL (CAAX protease family)
MFFCAFVSSLLVQGLFYEVGWPSVEGSEQSPATPLDYATHIFHMVLNSCAEEFVCRAYLFTRIAQLRSRFEAVVLSSILFASYHFVYGLEGLMNAFFIGVIFALCFAATGRIWPVIIGHTIYNVSLSVVWTV